MAARAAPVSEVKGAAPVSDEDALAAALSAPAVPAGTFGQIKLAQANREFLNFEFSTIFFGRNLSLDIKNFSSLEICH